jgi:hypothetical protein
VKNSSAVIHLPDSGEGDCYVEVTKNNNVVFQITVHENGEVELQSGFGGLYLLKFMNMENDPKRCSKMVVKFDIP